MPDASVIIPAYNAATTICEAVRSACEQSGISLEILVVDDASADSTVARVEALAESRVRTLRLECNGGPAAARNAAIDAATGEWIAVLDADDTMAPHRLVSLIRTAATHGLDIVADNMWTKPPAGPRTLFIDEALNGTLECPDLATYISRNMMFGDHPAEGTLKPVFSAAMLRSTGLHYDTATRIGEDFLLVAEAMAMGARYGRVREAGYIYTVGGQSISRRLSHADALAMIASDRRAIAAHAQRLDPAALQAWRRHLASLEDAAAFVGMVDRIKARDPLGFAAAMWQRPRAVRHFSMPIRARLARLARHSGAVQHGSGAANQ